MTHKYKQYLARFHDKVLTDKALKVISVLAIVGLVFLLASLIIVEMYNIEYRSTQHYVLASITLVGYFLTMYGNLFIICKGIFEIRTKKKRCTCKHNCIYHYFLVCNHYFSMSERN